MFLCVKTARDPLARLDRCSALRTCFRNTWGDLSEARCNAQGLQVGLGGQFGLGGAEAVREMTRRCRRQGSQYTV